jgi:hypothetical protein
MANRVIDREPQVHSESWTELFGRLGTHSTAWLRDEIDLAKREAGDNFRALLKGIALQASGALVLYLGLVFLGVSAVAAMGPALGYGGSALIVCGVLLIAGGIATYAGYRLFRRTSRDLLEKSLRTWKEDKQWIKELM